MSVVTADGICDVFGRPDNTPWWFGSPVIVREGGNGHIVTSTRKRQAIPTDGRLRIELEPGPTVVEFDDESWLVIVPESDITLWALIQASVSFPPDTPEQALINAVNAWLQNHPDQVKGPPGDPAPAPLVTAAVAEWLQAHTDEVKGPPGDDGEMTEAGTVELIEAHIVPTYVDNQTRTDVALSVFGSIGLVVAYMGALQDLMVKLTEDQTIDGVKTFVKAVSAQGISVTNDPGSPARIVLINADSGQSYEFRTGIGGQFTLQDSTHGKSVLAIDANAPNSAVWVQGDKIVLGAPLSMGGRKVTDAADPTAPQDYGTKAYIDAKVAAIVDSAPATLDTLDELANALGNDPNFATTVSTQIGLRALKSTKINPGTGLSGGGDFSADRTLTVIYGTTAGTAAQGNDPRLSDARPPTAHTHVIGDTTSLQGALDAKAPLVESVNVVNASGANQTIPDPATGVTMSRVTLTANCAFAFPAPVAGKSFSLALTQDATGGRVPTFPATAKWAGGTAPTFTATPNKTDRLTFLCDDGATWAAFVAGLNF